MPDRIRTGIYVFLILSMATVLAVLVLTSPTETDRVESIGGRIKCPVCQGESIANSPSQMARDMMSLVRERVSAGLDDEAIVSELLSSYSGAVLLDPPVSGSTLILWLAPLAALVIGVLVIGWWRRHPTSSEQRPREKPGSRTVVAGIALAVVFAGVVVLAGISVQDRAGPASGVADLDGQDLDQVSNQTLEAVIAANLDSPQIDGMRLALAARYVEEAQYGSAIDHYLAVAESAASTSDQKVFALIQMGRLVWDGNAEADLAISLFDRALELSPNSPPALYHKAVVLWCGLGNREAAAGLFEEVVATSESPELTAAASSDLEDVRGGRECR